MTENQTRPLEVTNDEFVGWFAGSSEKKVDERIDKNKTKTRPFSIKPWIRCKCLCHDSEQPSTHKNRCCEWMNLKKE